MKNNKINILGIGFISALTFSACSDAFLEDKKNYDNVTPDIYNYYEGANSRISDIYGWTLPRSNADANWQYNSTGLADAQAKATEEYSGFSVFVDPQVEMSALTGSELPDYFMGDASNIQASVYGRIRNINDVIDNISKCSLSKGDKDKLLGQAYFLRAWCYYQLVKWYGGVPLVKDVQESVETSFTPRSSAKECIEFILEDLNTSADLLSAETANGGWASDSDWGRVTSGTALALKGRVLLLWASPLFNRANDENRWIEAYEAMGKDLQVIRGCGYDLYDDGNNVNASTFAKMFTQIKSPENVFVTVRSNIDPDDNGYTNFWEEYIRPKNTNGKGNLIPSSMLINLFPMADGRRPSTCDTYTKLEVSENVYDSNYPFVQRDPRFYRTFAFPGTRWAYSGNCNVFDPNNPSYNSGKDYELWSYVWYTNAGDAGNPDKGTSYGADNLLANNKSVYIRKRSDDADVNSPLYVYFEKCTDKVSAFRYSGAPYIELRFAEVLLNYAEAACMSGNMNVAVEQLQKIRQRAGYTAENNYGLQADLASDKATCMSAILYERQIEFAYEGKRFDDMHRWMLFDGGTGKVEGAPASWTLTGWGGNTCTWLGVKPMNGQRRDNIEYRTADAYGVGGTVVDSDPLVKAGVERCAAIDLRKGDLDAQTETLKQWYKTNLVFKKKSGDARLSSGSGYTDLYVNYRPNYYFLGFTQGAMAKNTQLQQTIGWGNTNNGGLNGTFDPLAE